MVLDINIRQQNIHNTGATSAPTAGAQANAPINVPVGQGSGVENTNTNYNTNNSVQSQPQTKRTAKELYNAIAPKLAQYGINLSEAETLALLERVAGCRQEILLNLDNTEIQKHLQCLEAALKKLGKNGAEIDINALGELANDYNIAIHTGWTIKGFETHNKNVKKSTIQERLIETNCLSGPLDVNDPNYASKMEAAIEKFFEKTLLSRISENMPQREREEIYKGQLQTFGRLLVNTPDGPDKELLGAAIDKLYRTNIIPAAKAGLISMKTEEAQANFAKHIDLREATTTASEYESGVYLSEEKAKELANLRYSHMRARDIEEELPTLKEEAIDFFEKNKEALIEIDRKLECLENNHNLKLEDVLNKEEIALLRERNNLHRARYSGAITGIGSSVNSSVVESRNELLTTINADTFAISESNNNNFYREVMQSVSEYVEKHLGSLSKEFTKLMDEVTSGNYTTVADDVANGTVTELAQPQQPKTTTKSSSTEVVTQPDFGVERRETPANTETKIAEFYQEQTQKVNTQNNSEVSSTPALPTTKQDVVSITRSGGVKAFCDFAKNNGTFKAIVDVYNNLGDITNQAVVSYAQKMYKMLNHSRQELVLRNVASSSTSGFNELLTQTSDQVVLKLDDNFTSFYTNKLVEDAKEEAKEKIQHGLA